eukprot:gene6778-13732_t
MGQNYGEAAYWDERYQRDEHDPFDWLLGYSDISNVLEELLNKDDEILMIGCGNAPFSVDIIRLISQQVHVLHSNRYNAGYENITNIDISNVVINQQKEKYPDIKWEVMDVHDLKYNDESIKVVLDKSLIDTVLCYSNSTDNTTRMITEIYRVLSPGGRYITLSLHNGEDISPYFILPEFCWNVSIFHIPNPRWDESTHSRRASVHTLLVCDKRNTTDVDTHGERVHIPLQLQHVLTNEQYELLQEHRMKVNATKSIRKASTKTLIQSLDNALSRSISDNENLENHNQDH